MRILFSRRIAIFGVFYLLTNAAATIGAYVTQGPAEAFGMMVFTALFALPAFSLVQELESKRVARERNELEQAADK